MWKLCRWWRTRVSHSGGFNTQINTHYLPNHTYSATTPSTTLLATHTLPPFPPHHHVCRTQALHTICLNAKQPVHDQLAGSKVLKYLERLLNKPPFPGVEMAAAQLLMDWAFLYG